MKYIPGFEFVVGSVKKSKQPASLLERRNRVNNALNDKDFLPGTGYKIHNIRVEPDGVTYYFKQSHNPQLLNLKFKTIAEAEVRISRLIGA